MPPQNPSPFATANLDQVQAQFRTWRQNRKKREPIPEELWDAAVNLCGDRPISKVAQTLRLSYNDLKNKAQCHAEISAVESAPLFFELPVPSESMGARWTVEIQQPGGATMKIAHNGSLDVSELINAFSSTER